MATQRYDGFLGEQRRRRDLLEAMMAQSLQAKPARNWVEGLGNMGSSLALAYATKKKGDAIQEEEKAQQGRYASLVGAMLGAQGAPSAPQPSAPAPVQAGPGQQQAMAPIEAKPLAPQMDPLAAISQLETGGNANAANMTSPKGAMGQFQIMPATALDIAKAKGDQYALDIFAKDPLAFEQYVRDPQINKEYGEFYYNQQLQKFGNPVLAAAAYNAGPARVSEAMAGAGGDLQKAIGALPVETQKYVGNFGQMTGQPMPSAPAPQAAPQGVPPAGSVSPPAGGISAEQVMALLQDPATFELGQQLAGAMLQSRMTPQMQMTTLPDGSLAQIDPSTGEIKVISEGDVLSPEAMQQKVQLATAGRNVNVPNVPPGYQLMPGPNGSFSMQPVPGGPAAIEQEQLAAKAEAAKAQGLQTAQIVTQDIDRALQAAQNQQAWAPVTGLGGSIMSMIPGSAANDLSGLIDTIESNVAFDKLQAMRNASPTGGALGAVTERELSLLSSTLGSLRQSQSQKQFVQNLQRLKQQFSDIVNGPQTGAPGAGQGAGPPIITQDQYQSLPSGSVYIPADDPTKTPRVKP